MEKKSNYVKKFCNIASGVGALALSSLFTFQASSISSVLSKASSTQSFSSGNSYDLAVTGLFAACGMYAVVSSIAASLNSPKSALIGGLAGLFAAYVDPRPDAPPQTLGTYVYTVGEDCPSRLGVGNNGLIVLPNGCAFATSPAPVAP